MAPNERPSVGELLRAWRARRRLSQLDLGLEAGVSARHISFVETGRSRPSAELLLGLAEHLEIPLRERNVLLLAGGYAPRYAQTPLEDEAMAPVQEALEEILVGHEPNPTLIIDRQWELVRANGAALALLTEGVAPELLEPPVNAMRLSLHPDGLAPRILNFGEWSEHLLARLRREALLSQDPALAELESEVLGYPGVKRGSETPDAVDMLFVSLRLRAADEVLSLFSTLATFGTALDVTLEELAIETFFPADEGTRRALREQAAGRLPAR